MAEIKEGILGPISGKIGAVVGYQLKGRNFVRSVSQKTHYKFSPAQQLQQNKMRLVSSFVNKVRGLANQYCPEKMVNNKRLTGKEQLISLLMKQCITVLDNTPLLAIDRVLLAIGTLPTPLTLMFQPIEPHTFQCSWDTALTNILAHPDDVITLIAYHDEHDAFYTLEQIGERQKGAVLFTLPLDWSLERIHLWSIWESIREKRNSTSQYQLLVSPT